MPGMPLRMMNPATVSTVPAARGRQRGRTAAATRSSPTASSSPLISFAYFGRSTESAKPPVVATTICINHDPIAITIVFQR